MIFALIFGIMLAGALGGWVGAQLQTPAYTATAYVVIYRMPAGFTDLISPDEAFALQSVYQAGVYQDAVIARVLPYFPGLSANDVRRSVRIEIVAYSPLTRVIVTTDDPRRAVALANNISDTWAALTQQLYEDTFTQVRQRLTDRKLSADNQVAALQSAIDAQQAAKLQNVTLLHALQAELAAAQQQQQDLLTALASLSDYHDHGESLAYTALRANARDLEARPDSFQAVAVGAAAGVASALLLTLWSMRRSLLGTGWRRTLAGGEAISAAASATDSLAEGWR